MKTLLLSLLIFSASLYAATPTPAPTTILTATSTVRFVWDDAAPDPAIPTPASYDFVEKLGTSYKLLGNTKVRQFDVANIGSKTRIFGIIVRDSEGRQGVVREFVFYGSSVNIKYFVEVKFGK